MNTYVEPAPRQVPGYADLHRMVSQLLAERVPEVARVLVLGAGGGLELRALAEAHPGSSLVGVDPSAEMLATAATTVGSLAARIALIEGTIEAAPEGPFDGATSLLVFHFIGAKQRLETLRALRRRLRPGAPFALAHISFAQEEPERSVWVARHVAFGAPAGTDPTTLAASREAIATRLTILTPADDEAMLRDAGFSGVTMFYAGLSLRGWIAYA